MAEFPALPLWTDAYLGDTTHLTTIEHGAYLLLLMTAWRTPEIRLPDDDKKLSRFARLSPAQWARIKPTIADFFLVENGWWTQRRLTDEAVAVRQLRQRQSAKGRASALKRKGRHATVADPGSHSVATEAQPDGNLPISISNTIAKAIDGEAPSTVVELHVAKAANDHLWDAGKAFLIARGVSKSSSGSLIGKWKGKYGVAATIAAIGVAQVEPNLVDPIPFITKVLERGSAKPNADDPRVRGGMVFNSPC